MQQQVACNATSGIVTFIATIGNKIVGSRLFGNWVKQHREAAKLSQEGAAEKAGLSRYQWIRIENAQSGTKRDTVKKIAEVLNGNEDEALKLAGFNPKSENTEDELTAEIMKDLRISLSGGGKGLTKKQKQEIVDMAVTLAKGMAARNAEEEERK